MRSSDLTYVALALLAFVVSSGLFFYIGVTYGSGSIGGQKVAKVVVPLDSEADDLREELQALLSEKKQLTAEVAALTSEREALAAESAAVREERDELLALLAGAEKSLAARNGIPAVPTPAAADSEVIAAEAGQEPPVLETAAGPEAARPQIAELPSSASRDASSSPQVRVIYPSGGAKPTLSLQSAPSSLRSGEVTAGLEAGLEAFKNGEYGQAYETWLPLAEAGVRRAQFYVGGLFHDGRGVARDIVRAHYWLSLSDQAGYPLARPLLSEIEGKMSPQERATARSLLAGQQAVVPNPEIVNQ